MTASAPHPAPSPPPAGAGLFLRVLAEQMRAIRAALPEKPKAQQPKAVDEAA